ncbi:MAG: methylated-DNA--[protein]-cysteine S-methyltransferase, partial [Gaiellales bacterium]
FDVDVDLRAVPVFQRHVLDELVRVPYGEVTTYGALARRIGKPRAARAVGGALNRNPVPIIVPCHRVIGASGSLVGYAGGLERKQTLLRLEGAALV